MTTFFAGPANGQTLFLKRAAQYLRVTLHRDGTFDALDQPEDTPTPEETAFAYEIVGKPGWCHVRRKMGGGFFMIGTYKFLEPQPPAAAMRDNTAWREWVESFHAQRLAVDNQPPSAPDLPPEPTNP